MSPPLAPPPRRSWWSWLRSLRVDPTEEELPREDTTEVSLRGPARDAINMGYWKDVAPNGPDAIWLANLALYDLVLRLGQVSRHDACVVDAGCGVGAAIVHTMKIYHPQSMVGLNTSSVQLALARQRLTRFGYGRQVELIEGDAVKTPLPDASADVVFAVESAWLFSSRAAFFTEAARVLKPGGRLVIADLILPPPRNPAQALLLRSLRYTYACPAANISGREDIEAQVRAAGLEVVSARSIAAEVVTPFWAWFWRQPWRELARYPQQDLLFSVGSLGNALYPSDYLLLLARKG